MLAKDSSEEQLTPKQQRFIEELLAGHTIVFSAGAAGIGEKTAHKWLKLAHVQEAYKAAQRQLFEYSLTGLMRRFDKAIETLDRNMSDNPLVPPSTQVSAARIVLEQSIETFKISELEQKLREMEHLLRDNARGGRYGG